MTHYMRKKEKLLNVFQQSTIAVEPFLIERYGVALSQAILADAIEEFGKLIPEIPYIYSFKGKGKALNGFLLITVMELAAFKAMNKHGKSPAEAWEVYHHALRIETARIPRWRKWMMKKLLFSSLAMKIFSKRGRKQIGNFEVEQLSDAFGWGLARTQTLADGCPHCDFRFIKGGYTRISSKRQKCKKLLIKLEIKRIKEFIK
jgi:hypothetical protein